MNRKTIFLPVILALVSACAGTADDSSAPLSMPAAGFKASAKEGEALFAAKCSSCHGLFGKGTNNGPPLVNRIYRKKHHSDMSFYAAVQKGAYAHHWRFGNMPPIPGLSPEQTAHIIAFVRQLQKKAGLK